MYFVNLCKLVNEPVEDHVFAQRYVHAIITEFLPVILAGIGRDDLADECDGSLKPLYKILDRVLQYSEEYESTLLAIRALRASSPRRKVEYALDIIFNAGSLDCLVIAVGITENVLGGVK
jgi:hypothetical protein